MSEKTLHQVGAEAAELYQQHRKQSENLEYAQDMARRAKSDPEFYEKVVDTHQGNYDASVRSGAEFAKANVSDLHDLAVLEAHIGGMAVNVEQPVEVGQKVKVHRG